MFPRLSTIEECLKRVARGFGTEQALSNSQQLECKDFIPKMDSRAGDNTLKTPGITGHTYRKLGTSSPARRSLEQYNCWLKIYGKSSVRARNLELGRLGPSLVRNPRLGTFFSIPKSLKRKGVKAQSRRASSPTLSETPPGISHHVPSLRSILSFPQRSTSPVPWSNAIAIGDRTVIVQVPIAMEPAWPPRFTRGWIH